VGNAGVDHGENLVLIFLLVVEDVTCTINDLKHVSDIVVNLEL